VEDVMRRLFSQLTVNQKLALAAFLLGLVAIWASPYRGGLVTLDAKEMTLAAARGADRVGVRDVADWIIQGRADFRLIDLRGDREFAEYHIDGAEQIAMAALPDAGLSPQEKIVLCSEDGVQAAQAWVLLWAKRFRGVYILDGGLARWKAQVLFPVLAANPTGEQAIENERLRAVSAYFHGMPQAGGAGPAVASLALPKIEVPAAPPAGQKKPAKKKEGC
jgi:rhodanese-related sulfurtransferase